MAGEIKRLRNLIRADRGDDHGYGPVGAEFTAAVAEFRAAFLVGTQLSQRYATHAGNLRTAAAGYVGTDESGAGGYCRQVPSDSCHVGYRPGSSGAPAVRWRYGIS